MDLTSTKGLGYNRKDRKKDSDLKHVPERARISKGPVELGCLESESPETCLPLAPH